MRGVWRVVGLTIGVSFGIFCFLNLADIPRIQNENSESDKGSHEIGFVDPRLAPLPILLKPEDNFCKGLNFLVALHISANAFSRREMWRETYGRKAKEFGYNILFVLGRYAGNDTSITRQIAKESEKFGDILQSDFIDSYRNLTLKHISLLRFFNENCEKRTVLLKMDDDMMWKVGEASEFIKKFREDENSTISCHLFQKWPVHRHPKDKWFVSKAEYAPAHWPTFCGGMVYVASYSAIQKLLTTLHYSEFFWIDDAFLTGIVRSNSGFELSSINTIVNSQTKLWEQRLNGSYVWSLAPRDLSRKVFEMYNKL